MFAKITKSVFLIKKSNIQCGQVKATREILKLVRNKDLVKWEKSL